MLSCILTGRRLLKFLAPDGGGGSGGGGGAASGQSGGAGGNGGGGGGDIKTPFDDLPWDALPDAERTKLEKAKGEYVATLQQSNATKAEKDKSDQLARQFQSRADQLEAELKKLRPDPKQVEQDPYLNAVKEELIGAGYDDKNATALAPVFAKMFKRVGELQKKEIGEGLSGMAGSVLARDAESAFFTAQENDRLGMFQIPEVSQAVWDMVRQRVDAGVETNPDIVLNLAKMAWADHEADSRSGGGGGGGGSGNGGGGGGGSGSSGGAAGGGNGDRRSILPPTPPSMRTGGGTFFGGGGGIIPTMRVPNDPNAPKHALNEDTRQALAQTFKTMGADTGVYPKELKPIIQNTRTRR